MRKDEKLSVDKKTVDRIKAYLETNREKLYGLEEGVDEDLENGLLSPKTINAIANKESYLIDMVKDKKPEYIEICEICKKNGHITHLSDDEIRKGLNSILDLKDTVQRESWVIDAERLIEAAKGTIAGFDTYHLDLTEEERTDLQDIKKQLESQVGIYNEKSVLGLLERLNVYTRREWNRYLTDVDKGTSAEFRYVAHNMTGELVTGKFRTPYMSTSLITDKAMGLYRNHTKFGFLLNPKFIESANYMDVMVVNYASQKEDLYSIGRPPLILPQEVEQKNMETTIRENGEMLNTDKYNVYSETVLSDYDIIAAFCVTNGEGELNPNYRSAKKLAEIQGIPFKEIDYYRTRESHGLEPLTEETQKELAKNVLSGFKAKTQFVQYEDEENEFIDKSYKDFYEKFKEIKSRGEVSTEDILGVMRPFVLEFNLEKWRQNGVLKNGPFPLEYTPEEVKYMVDSRFDFSTCKSFEDYSKMFDDLKRVYGTVIHSEEIKTYFMEKYSNTRALAEIDNDTLRQMYEDGVVDFESVGQEEKSEHEEGISEAQIESSQDVTEVEIDSNKIELQQEPQQEQTEDEITTEDNSKKVEPPIQEEQESLEPESTYTEETIVESVTDGETKEETEEMMIETSAEENSSLWISRFQKWEGFADKLAQNVKNKFVQMKENITKAIRDRIKSRDIDQTKDTKDNEEGR